MQELSGRWRWSWDPVLALAPVVVILLVVLAALRHPVALWSGDQGVKWLEAESLRATGFRSLEIPYPASRIDPQRLLSPAPMLFPFEREDGVKVFKYSAAFALVSATFVELLGPRGFALLPALGLIALSAALWGLARRLLRVRGVGIPLLMACATPLGIYGVILWEHTPAWALGAMALLLVVPVFEDPGAATGGRPFVAGLAIGAACALRNEALLFGVGLAAALVRDRRARRAVPAFAAGLVLGAVPLLAVHEWIYGDWRGGQSAIFSEAASVSPLAPVGARAALIRDLVLSESEPLLWAIALATAAAARLPRKRAVSDALLAAATVVAAWTVLKPETWGGDGLLGTAPWLLLALALPAGKGAAMRALATAGAVTLLLGLVSVPNSGGAQWGPRYLMFALLPWSVLVLAAARAALDRRRWPASVSALVLLLLSVWVQIRGFRSVVEADTNAARLTAAVAARPEAVVATDVWYVPQLLGPIYLNHEILLLSGAPHVATLQQVLGGAEIPEFLWVSRSTRSKVDLRLQRSGFRCADVEPSLPYGLRLDLCRTPVRSEGPSAASR